MDTTTLAMWTAVAAAGFVWMGFALGAVLAKLALEPRVAWIPVLRFVAAARAAELPTVPVWIARGVAALGWSAFAIGVLARGDGATGTALPLAGLAGAGLVMWTLGSLFGWVMWVLGASRIEMRLVVEQRLWWVAALVPPLWASIIGFGSSRPIVAGPVVGAVHTTEPLEDDATRAIERVTVPLATQARAVENPRRGEASMTIDDYDVTGEYPRTFSPYDTGGIRSRASAPTLDDSEVHPVESWESDDDDDTIFTQRRRARWVLKIIGGEEYDLEDITTIGREGIRPIPGVLSIIDDTRTMSKLHARLRRESDYWYITDLGSTNGTYVRDVTGTEHEVTAQSEAKVNGILLLGDLEAVIVDQREVA
jgi:hypothetical protein